MASATILPPSSTAENPASRPWNFPMGVRTADKMTGVSMCVAILRRSNAHHYTALRPEPLLWQAGGRAPVKKHAHSSSTDSRRQVRVAPASLLANFAAEPVSRQGCRRYQSALQENELGKRT